MTCSTTISPAAPDEGVTLPVPGFTPVTVAFSRFLASLPTLVEAERDLGGYTGQDPAVDLWIRAAEAARIETLVRIDAVLESDAAHPGDARLHTVVQLYRRVMLSDDAYEVVRLRRQASRREALLLPETGRAPARANRLILAALVHLEAYLALDAPAEEPEAAFRPAVDYAELPAA